MGILWQCHCDGTKRDVASNEMWSWGGCSDDIVYGYNKSKQFTKNKHISSDIKELVRNHNNEAGRMVSVILFLHFVSISFIINVVFTFESFLPPPLTPLYTENF